MPIGHMTLRGAPRAATYLRTYATSSTGGPTKDNTMLYWGGGAIALLGLWWVYAKPSANAQTKQVDTKTVS